MKKHTEDKRKNHRDQYKKDAELYAKAGDEEKAAKSLSASIDITPLMAHAFIRGL